MSPAEFRARRDKATRSLKREGLDALLVTNESNIRYLSGFACADTALVLTKAGKSIFLADTRNIGEAESSVSAGVKALCIKGLLQKQFRDVIRDHSIRRLGVEEENVSLHLYKGLKKLLKGAIIYPTRDLIEDIRTVKSKGELRLLKENAAITKKVLAAAVKEIRPGKKERDIASFIDSRIMEEGARPAFETIVASGPNSAKPHAVPSDRAIGKDDIVLIDFGIRRKGYNTDITRTVFTGKAKKKLKEIYRDVEALKKMATESVRPGAAFSSVYRKLAGYLKKRKLEKYFLHALGHGIGMDVHEKPALIRDSSQEMRPGMVFTVEPGLYISGLGGVRIEDMVVVDKKGRGVLTA